MSPLERPVGEDDLSAYVDGRLTPGRRELVCAYLSGRPELAAELELDRQAMEALRERLRSKAEEPVPARLRVAAIRAERVHARRRTLGLAAAACLLLGIGGVAGWTARDFLGGAPPAASQPWAAMVRDALSAHRTYAVEIVHPVEVRANEEAHLKQWLSKRLRGPLVIPDLEEGFGLTLVGGRLLPAGSEVAALVMYADQSGSRLTLYVKSGESGETAMKYLQDGDLSAFSWVDNGYGYVVAAATSRERLHGIARAVAQAVDLEAAKRRRTL